MASERDGVIRLERYNSDARALVGGAQQLADEHKHSRGHPRFTSSPEVSSAALESLTGIQEQRERSRRTSSWSSASKRAQAGCPRRADVAYVSPRLLDLLDRAEREAKRDHVDRGRTSRSCLHALAQEIRGPVGEILQRVRYRAWRLPRPRPRARQGTQGAQAGRAVGGGGKPTSAESYTRDLRRRGPRGPLRSGHRARSPRSAGFMQILERRFKNHPMIIGEPGVGKTTIIRGLAMRMAANGDVPSEPRRRPAARAEHRRSRRRCQAARRDRVAAQGGHRQAFKTAWKTRRTSSWSRTFDDPSSGAASRGRAWGSCSSRCSVAQRRAPARHHQRRRTCNKINERDNTMHAALLVLRDRAAHRGRGAGDPCAASPRATSATTRCASPRRPSEPR